MDGNAHARATDSQLPPHRDAAFIEVSDAQIADDAPDIGDAGRSGFVAQRIGVDTEAGARPADQRTNVNAAYKFRRQLPPRAQLLDKIPAAQDPLVIRLLGQISSPPAVLLDKSSRVPCATPSSMN